MNFGQALEVLRKNLRVTRSGWKGMWLVLVSPESHQLETPSYRVLAHWAGAAAIKPSPWIGVKTADNCFVPWLASQADVLAEDWETFGE